MKKYDEESYEHKEKSGDAFEENRKALRRFEDIQTALLDERTQCHQDRRFCDIAGAQYEGQMEKQFENKIKLEVNKVRSNVQNIENNYRNNRITVNFIPKGGKSANGVNDLFRADCLDSDAEEASDNAFAEGCRGGFGAIRLCTEYEDEYSPKNQDRQRVKIVPIYEADSCVYWDLQAKKYDKSDAKECFVLTAMTRDAYEDEWGDNPSTWPNGINSSTFEWSTADFVYVAEHYVVEIKSETSFVFESLTGQKTYLDKSEIKLDPQKVADLEAVGTRKVDEIKYKKRMVRKYIRSGGKLLEDCGYIIGDQIPIAPFYGTRHFIDGIERVSGHIRPAKDAAKLANAIRSMLAEIAIKSPAEKPIFTPEQMAGHEYLWQTDDVADNKYLLINSITDMNGNKVPAGPVGMAQPPNIPPALPALIQIAEQDLIDILGDPSEAEKMVSNISGVAVEMIQKQSDKVAFIYLSNFAKTMTRVGKIWLSMAKKIYSESGRQVRGIGINGDPTSVVLGTEGADLSEEDFDVFVSVGPTSASARAAVARQAVALAGITQDPETHSILNFIALENMEGDISADIREFFRKKLVALGVRQPNEQDLQEMQQAGQQPDAQQELALAMAEEAQAKAAKARADSINSVADAELKSAKTAEVLTNIEISKRDEAARVFSEISQKMAEIAQPTAQG